MAAISPTNTSSSTQMILELPVEFGYSLSCLRMESISIQTLNTARRTSGTMQQTAQMPIPARAAPASPSELYE